MRAGEQTVQLRKGWFDEEGGRHDDACLRPACVRDEIRALEDFRVFLRPESLPLILLSRVVTRLGPLASPDVGVLERLDPEDLEVLIDAYARMNGYGEVAPT